MKKHAVQLALEEVFENDEVNAELDEYVDYDTDQSCISVVGTDEEVLEFIIEAGKYLKRPQRKILATACRKDQGHEVVYFSLRSLI